MTHLIIKFNPYHNPRQSPNSTGGQFASKWDSPHYTSTTFEHPAPREVLDLIRLMNSRGFEAYVVGGSLRDLMSGRKPKDWDFATSATPEQVKKIFGGLANTDFRSEAHGTMRVPVGDTYAELTTYREDTEHNGRHAVVHFTTDLTIDLLRRDLTINAGAWNPLTGEFVGVGPNGDPSSVLSAIQNKTVEFVGDADTRLREDYLRALRALRFAVMGEGWHMTEATKEAIRRNVENIREAFNLPPKEPGKISHERVRDEMTKAFGYPNGGQMPTLMHEVGLLDVFFPELTKLATQAQNVHHHEPVLEHILTVTRNVKGPSQVVNRWSALMHDIGKSPTDYEVNGKRIARGTAVLTDKVTQEGQPYGYSFIGHEFEGAKIAAHILGPRGYNLPSELYDPIIAAVNGHMAIPQTTASDKSIRTWSRKIGIDKVEDALALREADFTAKPHADYPAQAFADRIHKLMTEAPPTTKLAIDGNKILQLTGMKPGPQMRDVFAVVHDYLDTQGPRGNTEDQLNAVVKDWWNSLPEEKRKEYSK